MTAATPHDFSPAIPQAAGVPRGRLLARARANDRAAIETMFKQFIPTEERVLVSEFLGTMGVLGFGTSSFGCVTDKRVASIRVKLFREVEYSDGRLEHVNSGAIYQPSKVLLYLWVVGWTIVTFGIALLFLPLIVRLFYRYKRSGLVFVVREGIQVYMFCDRSLLPRSAALYRAALARKTSASQPLPAPTPAPAAGALDYPPPAGPPVAAGR